MAGVAFRPVAPAPQGNPAPGAVQTTELVGPAADATPGPVMGSNDGATITLPTVSVMPLPKVQGRSGVDRGDAAELVVLHARVGRFTQGDRITKADLGEGVNFDRLFALEAVAAVDAPAPAPAPEAPVTETKKGK